MSQRVRHRVLGIGLVGVVFLATSVSGTAEQQPLEEYQKQELQSLVAAVRGAVLGTTQATEKPLTINYDFLKGSEGNTYAPFTMVFDASTFQTPSVGMYIFVTKHVDPAAAPAAPAAEQPDQAAPAAPEPPPAAFEDAYFVDLSDQQGRPQIRISRAFSAPGGEYDLYLALRNSSAEPAADGAPPPTIVMQKEQVTIPDLWSPALATSSVILAESVEALSAPLTPEQQVANPYTLGTTRIVPKATPQFGKAEEMQMIFLVYNPGLKEGKPDVTVEYSFYQSLEGKEEYFNKTSPQEFNAQTLPPEFDVAAGHQIVAGQSIPLRLFPEGRFRVEIKITDNVAGSSVTQNVNFSVLPA